MNVRPGKTTRTAILAVALFTLGLLSRGVQAEAYGSGWYGEVQASYGYEDNISRTSFTEPDDRVASITFGGGYSAKVRDNAQVILSGYATYSQHDEFEALDNLAVSLGIDYTVQPGGGYAAPWYNITANLTNFEYEDSDSREGLLFNLDLSSSRRLSPNATGHLGLRYMNYFFHGKSTVEEDNDAAFKRDAHELYAGIDYRIGTFTYLFGEFALRRGDVLSTIAGGPAPGPDVPGNWVYDAETPDPIFDAPCERRCVTGYAYRGRGDTYISTLGIAFPLGQTGVNMDVSAQYFHAEGKFEDYQDWIVKLGLLWNF